MKHEISRCIKRSPIQLSLCSLMHHHYKRASLACSAVLQQILLKYYTDTKGSNFRHFVLLENYKDYFNYFTIQLPVFQSIFVKRWIINVCVFKKRENQKKKISNARYIL